MRTTISISDHPSEEAKKASAELNRTLREIIDEALAATLIARRAAATRGEQKPFKTFSCSGTQPGVDLHSNASLEELMRS